MSTQLAVVVHVVVFSCGDAAVVVLLCTTRKPKAQWKKQGREEFNYLNVYSHKLRNGMSHVKKKQHISAPPPNTNTNTNTKAKQNQRHPDQHGQFGSLSPLCMQMAAHFSAMCERFAR